MSSFAFLPRSIGKQTQKPRGKVAHEPHMLNASASEDGPSAAPPENVLARPPGVRDHFARAAALSDEELLALLYLSLSQYALWCAPDLQYQMNLGQEGYIPIKYLLNNSSTLSSQKPPVTELDLMRCLRSSTSSNLEARMLIAEPSRNEWSNRGQAHKPSGRNNSQLGGFEVRRKDWESVLRDLEDGRWNKEWWSHRTVYIERLPATLRSVSAVSLYVQSLFSKEDESVLSQPPITTVQSVVFPSHHADISTGASRCKGFAFVVLDSPGLVSKLSCDYPWERRSSRPHLDEDAVKFGLRVLPNASWEVLKAEYLSYQQHLLKEAAEEAATLELSTVESWSRIPPKRPEDIQNSGAGSNSAWYPQNCLVFVRNIDPGTNKTTLRALFQGILTQSDGGVDYVDFNKGIDSCHLRLASPSDTTRLVSHFETQSIAQKDSLDQVGSAPREGQAKIMLEAVQGKREELYWEKVPEKLRNAALERLARMRRGENTGPEQRGVKRKRQRSAKSHETF